MNMNLNPVNAAAQAMSAPAESAQGLASLGRNNDSMLMHVTPNEVQGLQQLAQNMGGSLTRNPQTGLPEAGFFDFIGNMLPTIAGIGLSMTPLGPMGAALATGAGTAAVTGDLGKGIMAGFGAYGGANLAQGLSNASSATNLAEGITDAAGGSMEGMVPNAASPGNFIDPAYAQTAGVSAIDPASVTTMSAPADVTFGNMAQGLENVTAPGGFDVLKQSMGTEGAPLTSGQAAFKVATPFAAPVLGAMAPPPMTMEEEDSGWGPFKSIAERRRENNPMMLAGGGPILEDGTGLAGLLDKRVGNEGETGGNAQYYAAGGLKQGAFILPADVVSHYGNGSSKAGLALLANKLNAKPIHGPGDGMSDGIATTIEGKQKARVADGEAYIAPADVKRLGGPKKLYAAMDKIRQARTGTKKQGKQINAEQYLPT